MASGVHGLFEDNRPRIVNIQAEERPVRQVQRDFYDSHRHRVFSLAFYMTGNELEAEQLLAQSFVKAFQTSAEPDSGVIDAALITGFRLLFQLTPTVPVCAAASSGIEGKNVRRTDLEEAIRELPAFERLVFLLRDVEGYAPEIIAKLLETPRSEVNKGLFSARVRLRSILTASAAERAA